MSEKTTFLAIGGSAQDAEAAIRLCGEALVTNTCAGPEFAEACVEREQEYPTGLPSEPYPVAIPHCKSDSVLKDAVCFLRLDEPVKFRRMDDDEETCDAKMLFNLAIRGGENHLLFLQKLMQLVMDEEVLEQLMEMPLEDIPAYLEAQLEAMEAA